MKNRNHFRYLFFALFAVLFFMASPVYSSTPIGTVTKFKGEMVIQTGATFIAVTQIGQPVNTGDRIQTKQGEVELTFSDGAVLKVRPYTNVSVDERDEESGFWIFKDKRKVRRLNCFVGKMRFKSGSSIKSNYLQTPTSVCALRGSDAAAGYDNVNSYLTMYDGQAETTGKFIEGFFADPGVSAAQKSTVYNSLGNAYNLALKAETSGDPVEVAKAQVEALKVVKAAATELQKNEDETVKHEAKLVGAAADAAISSAEANLSKAKAAAEAKAIDGRGRHRKHRRDDGRGIRKRDRRDDGRGRHRKHRRDDEESTVETTVKSTTVESTTVESTTVESTTVEPTTTVESTTVESTTVESTTVETTTVESTTVESTTVESTTVEPTTTVESTTVENTTVESTTVEPTTTAETTIATTSVETTTTAETTIATTSVETTTTAETTIVTTSVETTTTTTTSTTTTTTTSEETTVSPSS